MLSPAGLNQAAMRALPLPGASCFASARGLARFYAALTSGRLLPLDFLSRVDANAAAGEFNGQRTRWALGFELTELTEDASAARCSALGHAATGGSIALCVPSRHVALAVTVSGLSRQPTATKRILSLLLAECGLSGSPLEDSPAG